ncbi:ester cyclase [Shimia biformata]|uniref:ester cyclase n=1 Tax=Shimia biformata TaxID=1294299 RepID=UPI00194E5DCB|nr:ester cyclase [Shimia biformata]
MTRPSANAVAAAAPEMSRKPILSEFLRRVWSDGDVSAVDEFIADSYTIHNDPGDPWNGQTLTRDGFANRLVKSRAAAPDQTFTPVMMIEEGRRIAVAWDWTGTHLGDLPDIPATGKPISMTGLTIYEFDGDRLCGHWQVADRLGIYQQLMAQT